jgi:hypothetical protein
LFINKWVGRDAERRGRRKGEGEKKVEKRDLLLSLVFAADLEI